MINSRRDFLSNSAALAAAAALPTLARAADELPYQLKAGKPYAGTEVTLMLPNAAQYRAQKERLPEFEKMTGIKANFSWVPYGQLLDKITVEAVAGSSTYDVVTWQDSWGPALTPYLEPLDALIKRDGYDMDSFPTVFKEECTISGVTYGVPLRAQAQLLFYRKDLFKEAGVEVPTTWEQVIEVGRKVQEKSGVPGIAMDYGKGNGWQNLFTWLNFLYGKGGDLLDAKGNARFNDAAGVAATQDYLDMLTKYKIANPGSVQFQEGDKVNAMALGNAAMLVGWYWPYPVLAGGDKSKLTKEQVGFAQMPMYKGGKRVTLGNCMPGSISKLSKKKDAAWECLKWMTNADLQIATSTDKSQATTSDIVVTRTAAFKSDKVNAANDGLQAAGLKSLEGARPMPQFSSWPQMASVLEATISELASNGAPVKPALDAAAEQVNRVTRRSADRKRG